METKKTIKAVVKQTGEIVTVVKMRNRNSSEYYSTVDESKSHCFYSPCQLDFDLNQARISLDKLKDILINVLWDTGITIFPHQSADILINYIKENF